MRKGAKWFVLFLVLCLIFLSIAATSDIRGIRQKIERSYIFIERFGELEAKLTGKHLYKYDEQGNEVEQITYRYKFRFGEMQEIPESKIIYEYEHY
ncbi:hypothetical protein IBX65_06370 [Candidatus Aerophobetes bacterium]|nr:hypothetical protein [Candidatus Aerophobetes bacterium]